MYRTRSAAAQLSMTQKYIQFMTGSAPTSEGLFISDVLDKYTDRELEFDHAYIQWIFPLPEASRFNPDAPLIDVSELKKELQGNGSSNENTVRILKENHERAVLKMVQFWGIDPFNAKRLACLNGHNGLRFSRFIQCMVYHGHQVQARSVLDNVLAIVNSTDPNQAKMLRPSMDRASGMTIWEERYLHACKVMESA